jgi:penicillin V acylase-like amidase (Ntn superfamily)
MWRRKPVYGALAVAAIVLAASQIADACTRVLWNDNKLAVMVGRTMDWPESTDPILTVFPRGMSRDGGRAAAAVAVAENPAKWTSKYASMVTTIYGIGTADGFNERGLGAHMLYLNATDFGARDASKPGVQAGLWAQYALDNAATVNEALDVLDKIQVVMVAARGHNANVHLALEDSGGDSAIIEYIDGKPVIHHGRQFTVMTNDPSYDQQLALLKKLDFSKPSSDMPLPGNVNPRDRFARATYFMALLPQPKDERGAVAGVFAIARNVSVPFGAPYANFGIYNTEYRTVMNLTGRRYYFELSTAPNVIWADLLEMNLVPGSPAMVLNPDDIALSGNVTKKFNAAKAAF